MAKEDKNDWGKKKDWLERAWEWRTKNIRDPIRETTLGGKIGSAFDQFIKPYGPDNTTYNLWTETLPEVANTSDTRKLLANTALYLGDFIESGMRILPRSLGVDLDIYNPLEHGMMRAMDPDSKFANLFSDETKEDWGTRKTYIPGLDFSAVPKEERGWGALQHGDSGIGNFLQKGSHDEHISLANPNSTASKFIKQYDSNAAFDAYMNDNYTEENRKEIMGNVDRILGTQSEYATSHPYNDPGDYYKLKQNILQSELAEHFFEPYKKEIGEKYRERMLSEFGQYDTQNYAYFDNLGYVDENNEPISMPLARYEKDGSVVPYTVDEEWHKEMWDGDEKFQMWPDEFNFGAFDPLMKSIGDRGEHPFKYSEEGEPFYGSASAEIAAGLPLIFGGSGITSAITRQLPKGIQTALQAAYPISSQLRPKNSPWWWMKYPMARGVAQTLAFPTASELYLQRSMYPEE